MVSSLSYACISVLAGVAFGCNTAEQLAADSAVYGSSHKGFGGIERTNLGSAPLTLLPQDEGDESPACLDGSQYGFYFNPSASGNSTKWTISIEGGGWCYDEDECYSRSLMSLGSSKGWSKTAGCGCMNTVGDGLDADCNCIYMPYGDGASFSGFRKGVWPVQNMPGKNLTFRGIKNFDATLKWAFEHGMDKATEFVITGGSAGGLSTFLHADRAAAAIEENAPDCKKVRAAPVVGYFLDHDNFQHTTGVPNTPSWGQANYTTWMKYIYTMQNLTFGTDGGLTEQCMQEHPTAPGLCFMSPHMQDTIKTPFFMFNSKYDAWQLGNEFQSHWTTPAEQQGVLQYGLDFMTQFKPVTASAKNGAMITSCICHGCPWADFVLDNKTSYQHYAAWMDGTTTGMDSIHVDSRLPNGGGTMTFSQCAKFPAQQQQQQD
eukprot:m.21715 g.21715  ORF g.21715 m.21715 type:complete len:432 (-) comp13512_c0_seq1:1662-2957(-)